MFSRPAPYIQAACALTWRQVLRLLRLPARDLALLTPARADARIHVAFMGKGLLPEALQARLDEEPAHSHIVAFRPTGMLCPEALTLLYTMSLPHNPIVLHA